jgi:hypothetical protein
MEIRLKYEFFGGRPLYKPACELSKAIAEINNKRTFSIAMIERAKKLGIKIVGLVQDK